MLGRLVKFTIQSHTACKLSTERCEGAGPSGICISRLLWELATNFLTRTTSSRARRWENEYPWSAFASCDIYSNTRRILKANLVIRDMWKLIDEWALTEPSLPALPVLEHEISHSQKGDAVVHTRLLVITCPLYQLQISFIKVSSPSKLFGKS